MPKMIQGQYFGQECPRDQLKVILGSILGHLDNLKEGIIDGDKAVSRIAPDVERALLVIENTNSLSDWNEDD